MLVTFVDRNARGGTRAGAGRVARGLGLGCVPPARPRTDARATDGLTEALERASAFIEDGADITFVEAPLSIEEMCKIPVALNGTPQLVNLVVGGKTPILALDELGEMGFSLVLYANVALQAAVHGMQIALGQLKETGKMDQDGPLASFLERQRMVRKDHFDKLEQRYAF